MPPTEAPLAALRDAAETNDDPHGATLAALDAVAPLLAAARTELGRVILGQQRMVDQALIGLLSGGHVLLVGLPGLGKSRLVQTLAIVLGLDARRVQFTPDLMPADILGSEVLHDQDGTRQFRFLPGPIFCQLLMADEINRASPRTQSALLQAMQEREVSIAGHDHALPAPFHVMATQNPIEQEGTYPLPEAQLDRFLLQIEVGYPDAASERAMLLLTTGAADAVPVPVFNAAGLIQAQALIRRMPVGVSVLDAILALVRSARPDGAQDAAVGRYVAWGPGPRAAQALMLATRARALLDGRLSPNIADVQALAQPVLRHRMALNFAARAEGIDLPALIDRLAGRLG